MTVTVEIDDRKTVRILFVHEIDYLDKPVYEIHEFPELLAQRGHIVDFIDYPEASALRLRRLKFRHRVISGRVYPNSKIHLMSQPVLWPGTFGRIIAFITFIPLLVIYVLMKRPHVIVNYAVPTTGWITVTLARLIGIPTIFRAIDASDAIRDTRLRALVRIAESYVCRKSTMTLANNEVLAERCRQLGSNRVLTFPPGFELPASSIPEENLLSSAAEFDAVFMGTLFPFSGLDDLLIEMSRLQDEHRPSLLIIGTGVLEPRLRQIIKESELDRQIHLVGHISFSELALHLRRARVGIIPFRTKDVTNVALPAKAFQYLLAGLPIVSTPLKGLRSALPEGRGTVFVEMGPEFLDQITRLSTNPELRTQMVDAGKSLIEFEFNWRERITELEQLLQDICQVKLHG